MTRRHRASGPANPRRDCPVCRGTGWVESAQAPLIPSGADPRSYSRPVVRCACTSPREEQRPEPQSLFDQAQKAAGEREEA